LIGVLILKSVVLDPNLGTLTVEEQTFQKAIETSLEVGYREKWAYRYGLLAVRIVDIKNANESDIKEANAKGLNVQYAFSAKVRRYLLGVLPIGEFKLMK